MRWTLRFSADRPRVAIMASKEPHCLHDLLNRWRTGELDIEVPVLVSNHPDHAAIAEWFGVEYANVPIVAGAKADHEPRVRDLLQRQALVIAVLARTLQELSTYI